MTDTSPLRLTTNLPQHLQATLEILHAYANNEGKCQMSLSELARERGVASYTMHRHVHQLELNGYITIHYRPGKSSIYQLISPEQRPRGITGFLQRLRRKPRGDKDTSADQFMAGTSATLSSALERSEGTSLIGREKILATLQENVVKRQHTLLIGPLGIGKSHILRQLVTDAGPSKSPVFNSQSTEQESENSKSETCAEPSQSIRNPKWLYLEHISPIKPALLSLAERLHADGDLDVKGIEAGYMEWEDVRKKIAPLRVNQLTELVTACMKDQNYILVLDHLERVTPTMLPHLDALMNVAVVIAAADEPSGRASGRGLKSSAQRLWWAFEQVEIPPLTREQARELLWQVADRDRVAQPQLFETRVLQQAGGNPLAIITMAGKARTTHLSAQEIRSLRHGAGTRYIPLTPALMLIGALIVAARFVALGLNDRDLYVLAGLGYAFFFFMRYFIYRID